MKIKKNVVFSFNGKEHFLFQIMNFGKETDELKFVFNDPKAGTGIIHTEESGSIKSGDIITTIGESTYHADGSFFYKFPSYPLSEKAYQNPHGTGERRIPLNKITQSEPLFTYDVFQYDLCAKKKRIKESEKFLIENDHFFDGKPFGMVITLVNSTNHPYERYNEGDSIYVCVPNVASNLDLCIAFGKLTEIGKRVWSTDLNKEIFTRNSHIQIVEWKEN